MPAAHQGQDQQRGSTGLVLHSASRMEFLLAQLIRLLAVHESPDPLAATEIVVAHPGLGRWLRQALAETRGIAANLRLLLPGQWLARVQDEWLGKAASATDVYERATLRWVVFDLLATANDAELRGYLAGNEPERRRFQLADRLAAIYTQYLVYRRDWLEAWQRGEEIHWQANLWRAIVARIGGVHRAANLTKLLAALQSVPQANARAPNLLFGLSHLPPDMLAVVQGLARHQTVHLLYPNPCEEMWTELASERQIIVAGDKADDFHLDIGHPLLAALGGQGQDFLRQLLGHSLDLPDPLDQGVTSGTNLLHTLQHSIRSLRPDMSGANPVGDASLRVHACHTRLRELEVLRDAMLDRLSADPQLQPRQIVVMAPDIGAYAALLPAVFSAPATAHGKPGHLPWHLADQILRHAHPLIDVFRRLLDLDHSRFEVNEILDLLDVDAVALRFDVQHSDREAIRRWATRSHVAWALDESMRAEFDAPADRQHTWAFGIDRMSWGYLVGGDGPARDGLLALAGVEGLRGQALGLLADLLDTCAHMRREMREVRSAHDWSDWLQVQLQRLFEVDSDDVPARAAIDALTKICSALVDETECASITTPLAWSVVREYLDGKLDAIPERQRFLAGGITFCGMVPFRTIPFDMVCILGLNDGEFPRRETASGLNRMADNWRSGDRDAREEDRYLFLEAIMAARTTLHLSYLGEGARDGRPRNPAAPLADLLRFLQNQFPPADDAIGPNDSWPWLVQHPLQPFDTRYFGHGSPHDARLYSFRHEYAQQVISKPPDQARFADHDLTVAEVAQIPLADLQLLMRNPAKLYFSRSLQLRLDDVEDETPDDIEPLQARVPARERIERELFRRALAGSSDIAKDPEPWLDWSGVLAPGNLGRRAYDTARDSAVESLSALRESGIALRGDPQTLALDLQLGPLRITGRVADVYPDQRIVLFGRGKPARVGHLLDLHLRWLLLTCATGKPWRAIAVPAWNKAATIVLPWRDEASEATKTLLNLCALQQSALRRPLLFFPETSWAWCAAAHGKKPESALVAAKKSWHPVEYVKGFPDSDDPYFALAARGRDFLLEGTDAHAEFVELAERLCAPLLATDGSDEAVK